MVSQDTTQPAQIVVVDDDKDIAHVVQSVMRTRNIEVACARWSSDLFILDLSLIKLVLIDLHLDEPAVEDELESVRGGANIARKLRSRGFQGAVVAYSGAECSPAELTRDGFDGLLSKAAPLTDLIALCERCLYDATDLTELLPPAVPRSVRHWALQAHYIDRLFESVDLLREQVVNDPAGALAVAHRLTGSGQLYQLPGVSRCADQLYSGLIVNADLRELHSLIDSLEKETIAAAGQLARRHLHPSANDGACN